MINVHFGVETPFTDHPALEPLQRCFVFIANIARLQTGVRCRRVCLRQGRLTTTVSAIGIVSLAMASIGHKGQLLGRQLEFRFVAVPIQSRLGHESSDQLLHLCFFVHVNVRHGRQRGGTGRRTASRRNSTSGGPGIASQCRQAPFDVLDRIGRLVQLRLGGKLLQQVGGFFVIGALIGDQQNGGIVSGPVDVLLILQLCDANGDVRVCWGGGSRCGGERLLVRLEAQQPLLDDIVRIGWL